MAANSKSAAITKRVVTQIWTSHSRHLAQPSPPPSPLPFFGRTMHTVYDKNQEDLGQPNTVPNEVIEPQSDKYWAPHPKTGVFGPVADSNKNSDFYASTKNGDGAMEEKAWFRPTSLEDLEKPV